MEINALEVENVNRFLSTMIQVLVNKPDNEKQKEVGVVNCKQRMFSDSRLAVYEDILVHNRERGQ